MRRFHLLQNLFNDLPGALSSSSGADPGHISAPQQDSVYLFQIQFPQPWAVRPAMFHVSLVIDNEKNSERLFNELQHVGFLTDNGEVNTAVVLDDGFGKNFARRLAFVPQYRQKQIIDILFWWNEESARLHKLFDERASLSALRDGASETTTDRGEKDRLEKLLERINHKIGTKPSERDEKMERNEDSDFLVYHRYGGGSAGSGEADSALPTYTAG